MFRRSLFIAAGLAVAAPALAGAAPAIDRGWPVVAPPGEVLQGPNGGPLVSSTVLPVNDFAVAAYRKNGRRQWFTVLSAGCGNCDGGAPTQRWPDGSYGPIGFTGDDFWSVDETGRTLDACSGVTLADSTCISYTTKTTSGTGGSFEFRPAVQARRDGAMLWEYVEDMSWLPESDTPPRIVRDRAGVSYVSFGSRGGGPEPRLLAINPAGTLRWRAVNGGEPIAALGGGVVVNTETGIAVVNANGTTRWEKTLQRPRLAQAAADVRRGRVYVNERTGRRTVIRAHAAATGDQLWRTTANNLVSIGRRGNVYVRDEGPNTHHLRAIGLDGRLKWRFKAATTINGAYELRDGRVAVSTGTRFLGGDGLLYRINPKRRAPRVRRAVIALSSTLFATRCRAVLDSQARHCGLDPSKGTILEMRLPQSSRVRLQLRDRAGKKVTALRPDNFTAPAGISYQRLLAGDFALSRGAYTLSVTWRQRGRSLTVRLPIRIR